jgi:hypothetical protein
MLEGRPKASSGGDPLEIVLCTHVRFLDADGKVSLDETKATRIDEQLAVVMIRESHSRPAVPSCPE